MKVPAAALVSLLLLVICSPAEVQLNDNFFFMTCCFNYVSRPIPRSVIVSIEETHSSCHKPGVIVVTKRGRHICANPDASWVKALQHDFQKR